MRAKFFQADFFWPLALLATLAMGVLSLSVFELVRQFDLAALRREQVLVANGLESRAEEVTHMVVPQAIWDDAVRHLDNRFDPKWAQENIGQFLGQTDGFANAFVLDAADRPIFAAEAGRPVGLARFAPFAPGARGLVAAIRKSEAERAARAASGHGAAAGQLAKPVQADGIVAVGGRLYLLSATLVQPDFGTAAVRGPHAPIVVAAMALDAPFLQAFGRRYMLEGLRLEPATARPGLSLAKAPLRDNAGALLAHLVWTPQAPGLTLLRRLGLPILAMLSALAAASLVLLRRSRRMAESLIASEARATHLAYHDPMTGLPNRVLFFDRLDQALARMRRGGPPVAVHAVDLDRFKQVNDTYGHHVGDELIQAAALRMAAQCRTSDTLARLSGDEFAIIQVGAAPAAAAALAARLVEIMAEPVALSAGRVFVGCSVGLAVVSDGAAEAAEVLRQADLALYRAKENGRDQHCFFELEMDAAMRMRRALESDLRAALAAGALQVAYQPQVDGGDKVTGVEALVRWTHPQRGAVSPGVFVPIAEECGLIDAMGMFTLKRAFEDSRRWPDLKVAINVSANQLRLKDFIHRLAEMVAELGVDPSRFDLEITEGVLLGDDPVTHDALKRLRQMGFSLALDDFGTGFSSLGYLQRYPINKIKIDRSFIANLGVDAQAEAVVGAIVTLARALSLAVIAEGVETRDQRRRLTAAGCDAVQGFLFGQPAGVEAVDGLYARRGEPLVQRAA